MDTCPNCNGDKWEFVSGWQDGEPIEPDEGWCEECGFHYQEHCKHPISEQIAKHRGVVRARGG